MRVKLAFIISIFFFLGFFSVHAASVDNLSGWAWTDTTGWLSFNNTTDGSHVSYGVRINETTGALSGYAWSDTIGWVSFNAADTVNCPVAPCAPSLLNNTFEGWARALVAIGRDDGWDGWIALKGGTFGVTLQNNAVKGYGWGHVGFGWCQFDPVYGGVFFNNTGEVRVRRVDSTGADLGSTIAILDEGVQGTENPTSYIQISAGQHKAGVLKDNRALSAGECTYAAGGTPCTVSVFDLNPVCTGIACSVPVTVAQGMVSNVTFKYTNTFGDIIVKRVGVGSDSPGSAPEGTTASLDNGTKLNSNATEYRNVQTVPHTLSVSKVGGYSVEVGSCSFAGQSVPENCTVTSFVPAPLDQNGDPSFTETVLPDRTLKVVFQYRSSGTASCEPEQPGAGGVRLKEAPVGQPVRWSAVGAADPDATYVWQENGATISSGVGVRSITKVYTVKGYKSVTLSINGEPATACDVVNDQPTFQVSASPTYRDL